MGMRLCTSVCVCDFVCAWACERVCVCLCMSVWASVRVCVYLICAWYVWQDEDGFEVVIVRRKLWRPWNQIRHLDPDFPPRENQKSSRRPSPKQIRSNLRKRITKKVCRYKARNKETELNKKSKDQQSQKIAIIRLIRTVSPCFTQPDVNTKMETCKFVYAYNIQLCEILRPNRHAEGFG